MEMKKVHKWYPVNCNNVQFLEAWLTKQHSKGLRFVKGNWLTAQFNMGKPANVQYRLKAVVRQKYLANMDEGERTQAGWQYVGKLGRIGAWYRVYSKNGDDMQESCPDTPLQKRNAERAIRKRRIQYGVSFILLLWWFLVCLTYLYRPTSCYTEWYQILFFSELWRRDPTPLIEWQIGWQCTLALSLGILFFGGMIHNLTSLFISFYARNQKMLSPIHTWFHRIVTVFCIAVTGILFITNAFFAIQYQYHSIPSTQAIQEKIEAPLEIPNEMVWLEEGSSFFAASYTRAAYGYLNWDAMAWVREYNFWTDGMARMMCSRFLNEVGGEELMSQKIGNQHVALRKGVLWTGEQFGYFAYVVDGSRFAYMNYHGPADIQVFWEVAKETLLSGV